MSHWFAVMQQMDGRAYGDQIARLRDGFGFSRAHANAVVMYCRGSASSRRYDGLDAYLDARDPVGAETVRAILAAVLHAQPDARVVIAWNHPMVKVDDHYVFGVSLGAKHILLAPIGRGTLDRFRPRLDGYVVNKKTVRVPLDWAVDSRLLAEMAAAGLASRGAA